MNLNEQTSSEVATYASEILKMDKPAGLSTELWNKIQSVAGSALTQTKDKPKSISQQFAAMALAKKKVEEEQKLRQAALFKKMFKK